MCFLCDLKTQPVAAPEAAPSSRRAFLGAGASFAALVAAPALAQVQVGEPSTMRKLVPADLLEEAAAKQYDATLMAAQVDRALLPATDARVQRLRTIADRLIPFTPPWNERASQWQWQVSAIQSEDINAFCMPGGKIVFFTGILEKLDLTEDEVAMIMGHEMAHALREHSREQIAKGMATSLTLRIGAELIGLGDWGGVAADIGSDLLTLKFSRDNETEADLVGLELAARAGYRPDAGVSLWQKMEKAKEGASLAFLSTHPSGSNRIRTLERNAPKVQGLYERATAGRG
ncbi:M48 family metallopeptidase [Hydrogenophaga sp. 5NK40-0174]|uniref:M48 family metallopeptidase n=1 Tax=Hydrogenophaga sp. 5NK40-0174 TaxID=3127649 RepID=UPI00310C2D93